MDLCMHVLYHPLCLRKKEKQSDQVRRTYLCPILGRVLLLENYTLSYLQLAKCCTPLGRRLYIIATTDYRYGGRQAFL